MEGPDPLAPLARIASRNSGKKLPKISEKVLADQLRQLEADGVLTRKVTTTSPPQVTYSLNAQGKKLVPLMETFCDWGSAHFGSSPICLALRRVLDSFLKQPLFPALALQNHSIKRHWQAFAGRIGSRRVGPGADSLL